MNGQTMGRGTGMRAGGWVIATLLALSAVIAVACSGDSSSRTPSGGDVIELDECENVRDCRGGELCLNNFCRLICEDDEGCDGALALCAPEAGICVQCLAADDCGEGFDCSDNWCVGTGCEGDQDCPDDESCNTSTGECEARGCESNRDCRGGEVCSDGRCRPVQQGSCTPGTSRCEDGSVLDCDSTGTREVVQRCGATEICVEDGDQASCQTSASACSVGDTGCNRDGSRWVCDASNRRITERCSAGSTCVGGQCASVVCTPGSTRCDGNVLVLCDAAGQSEVSVACSSTDACDTAEFGCACSEGQCVERVCTPGSARCQGGNAQRCSPDGTSWLVAESCSAGETCVAGGCVSSTCAQGESQCVGDVELFCVGNEWDTTDCGRRGQSCSESGGSAQCVDRLCTPGTRECEGGSGYRTCNGAGSAWTSSSCAAGQVCSGGACVTRACEPGERRCNANAVQTCNTEATGWTHSENCGADATCTAGTCETTSRECIDSADCPAPSAYCDGDTAVSWPTGRGACVGDSCDFASTSERVNCANNGQTCENGACRTASTGCSSDDDCSGSTPYCRTGLFQGGTCVQCRRTDHCSGGQTCVDNACTTSTSDCTSTAQCRTRAIALGATTEQADNARCDSRIGCYTKGRCGTLSGSVGDIFGSTCLSGTTCGDTLGFYTDACSGCRSNDDCREGEVCTEGLIPFPGFGDTCL